MEETKSKLPTLAALPTDVRDKIVREIRAMVSDKAQSPDPDSLLNEAGRMEYVKRWARNDVIDRIVLHANRE